MAENLRYLPAVFPGDQGSNVEGHETGKFYYVYGYNGTDVTAAKAVKKYNDYGVLYNWYATMDGAEATDANPSGVKGPCPEGWHVPSSAEWKDLSDWVYTQIPDDEAAETQWIYSPYGPEMRMAKNVSGVLRSKDLWDAEDDSELPQLKEGGLDRFGFNAKPAGSRHLYGAGTPSYFNTEGRSAGCWATEINTTYNDDRNRNYMKFNIHFYDLTIGGASAHDFGFSIRCVKDLKK